MNDCLVKAGRLRSYCKPAAAAGQTVCPAPLRRSNATAVPDRTAGAGIYCR